MAFNSFENYPLSKLTTTRGSRRLAREKVLQIINAYLVCETPIDELFKHIFGREFNFGENETQQSDRLLRPEEIVEMEADIPIEWKDEEIEFGKELVRLILLHREYFDELIEEFAKNWELERIAQIDRILLYIATVEFMHFNEIPPKVSINEALDISKKYSTDKSKVFINGVLDSILEKFKSDDKLNKTGRGLIENSAT